VAILYVTIVIIEWAHYPTPWCFVPVYFIEQNKYRTRFSSLWQISSILSSSVA